MSTAEEILNTAALAAPFIKALADHIHHDGPEPEGLASVPTLKARVELEKLKLRSPQKVPGVGV